MERNGPYNKLNDEELLLAYRQGRDNRYLGLLLQRYTILLLGVAMKYLKDKEQAQDAVQQVFLKVLTHFPQEEILNFKGWLYILMRNHCLQQLRDKKYNPGDEALAMVADEAPDKEELIGKEQTLEQMSAAMQELQQEQRVCIDLFYLQKKSYQQITEQTGYSFMQVKSYIQNGKRNLKMILLKKAGRPNE